MGLWQVRTVTVVAQRFVEVSTLNPVAIEPVLDLHVGLRRRLRRYGKLKKQLDTMLEVFTYLTPRSYSSTGINADNGTQESETIDEVSVEVMKGKIEEQFDASIEDELRGIFDDADALGDANGKLGAKEFGVALQSEFADYTCNPHLLAIHTFIPWCSGTMRCQTRVTLHDFGFRSGAGIGPSARRARVLCHR
jgi:hypothetical protein